MIKPRPWQCRKNAFSGRSALSRWQLAGQLRELVGGALCASRFISANRQLDEAQALAKDVGMRVQAGDLAALDQSQAKAEFSRRNSSKVLPNWSCSEPIKRLP